MSAVSTPWSLESGTHFNFETSVPSYSQYFRHLFKMLKCPLILSLLCIILLATLLVANVHCAPALASLPQGYEDSDFILTGLPSPPPAREERDTSTTSSLPTPPAVKLPFIKNSQCSLHKENGKTRSKMCGLRQLDVPGGVSGIKSWNPSICRPFHCKCVATKDVQRIKRTIADNKTTLDFHRYRVFQCV